MAIKFEQKIYGRDLDELNDRLLKFLKGRKKLLRGRKIDTITDEDKGLYMAVIRIDDNSIMNSILDHYNSLNLKEKSKFRTRLKKWVKSCQNGLDK
jgi:uncharacterized protein YkvS